MPKLTGGEKGQGYRALSKGFIDFTLISTLTFSLFYTVTTSSDHDTRWDETVPIIIGAVLFPATLYIFEVIQSVVSSIRNSLIQRRRHGGGIDHLDTSMTRFEDKPQKKRKPVSKSMVKLAANSVGSWFAYAKLSITFMMNNSCLALLFWDTIKLILWLVTITYWRRNAHTDDWDFSLTPLNIYRLHYVSLSLTNTELCLFILGAADIKDVLCSPLFWVNLFILPPITLFTKLTIFRHLSFFQIYLILGFVIWVKCFLLLDRIINLLSVGIERKIHRIWRIGIGIFLIASAFASSMYVLQGIHPFAEKSNQFVYSLSHFGEFFYFSFITFSTVGYGDMTPLTIQAKLIAVCFVSCMLVWVPYEVNNLIQAFGGKNRISGHISTWGTIGPFILLIGEVDPIQLSLFVFKNYYAGANLKIIVLTNMNIEAYDMQINQAKLLRQSLCIINDEVGLNGNIDILHTIKANQAAAAFVLSTFKDQDVRKMDMKAVARVIGLKKFGCVGDNVLVQFCSPIGPQISLHSFGNIVSLYRVKMALIAKNITCPGIITLIINLSLTHNAAVPKDTTEETRQKGTQLYKSYLMGIGKCVRMCEIPDSLIGVSFETLCSNLYMRHGYITIGIMRNDTPYRSYTLNPAGHGYIIKEGDKAILVADSTYTKSVHQDIVSAGRSTSLAVRASVINMVMQQMSNTADEMEPISKRLSEVDHYDIYHNAPTERQTGGAFAQTNESVAEHQHSVNSIVVTSVTFACNYVFEKPSKPIIAIIGYSAFVPQLLCYFEELGQFNVVIFGMEASLKMNINVLLRFKSFLAVIDGDPMRKRDVNRAELDKACYIYVLPSPPLNNPGESDEEQDLRTIVTYRQLKSIMQVNASENKINNPYSNIFSLVELHSASNVAYLDDRKWSAWNVFDKRLDPSLSYIHSAEFSMGQFISDEMLYSLTMNTMVINDDYTIYKILLHLGSVGDPNKQHKGVKLISINDISMESSKRTFGNLFNYLFCKRNQILIGIYRVGAEPMDNCVICAPPQNFYIRHMDMAYVIGNDGETYCI